MFRQRLYLLRWREYTSERKSGCDATVLPLSAQLQAPHEHQLLEVDMSDKGKKLLKVVVLIHRARPVQVSDTVLANVSSLLSELTMILVWFSSAMEVHWTFGADGSAIQSRYSVQDGSIPVLEIGSQVENSLEDDQAAIAASPARLLFPLLSIDEEIATATAQVCEYEAK